MVHTAGPGKIVFVFIFCFEILMHATTCFGKVPYASVLRYLACRDGEQRSAVLQQYFIVQRRGKPWSMCVAPFQKIFSQNRRYLAARSVHFAKNRPRWI